ncbi:MAG: hypothetical protein R3A11_06900 [Bdellovibrionota bacterium]
MLEVSKKVNKIFLGFALAMLTQACAQQAVKDTLEEMRSMNQNMEQMNANTAKAIDTMAGIQKPIEDMAENFNQSFRPEQINAYVENALASFEEKMNGKLDDYLPLVQQGTQTLENFNQVFAQVPAEQLAQLGPAIIQISEFTKNLNQYMSENANVLEDFSKSMELFATGSHQLMMSNHMILLLLKRMGMVSQKEAITMGKFLAPTAQSTGDLAANLVELSQEKIEQMQKMISSDYNNDQIIFVKQLKELTIIGRQLEALFNVSPGSTGPLKQLLDLIESQLNDANHESLVHLANQLLDELQKLNNKFSWFSKSK